MSFPRLELSELRLETIKFIPSTDFSRFERTPAIPKSFNSLETFERLVVIDSMLSIELLI